MARERKIDAPIQYSSSNTKHVLFGWCMTGHHKKCIVTFPGHECSCKCHVEENDVSSS